MILLEPLVIPVTLYDGDDFDLQLNWRERCGDVYLLSTYDAKMTFYQSSTDRSPVIYQITSPPTAGNGILLADASPNIWAHILAANVDFASDPPKWYFLELQTPTGADPMTDGVWFRFAEGKVTYKV